MKSVVVVGGGAVGLACAYELRKRDVEVTLIDKGQVGQGASKGNAGWVTPAHSGPVPSPGLTFKSLAMMLSKDSPLYIHPPAIPRLAGWLMRFRGFCNQTAYSAGLAAQATLNQHTLAHFDELEQEGVEFEMHRSGLLFLFESVADRDHYHEDLPILQKFGISAPRSLERTEVAEMEPGLQVNKVVGALLYEDEVHVEPTTLCEGLAKRLTECGGEIREGVELEGPIHDHGRIAGVRTDRGAIHAEGVVLAAGAWTGVLAGRFGHELPVQAGKGYSITVERPDPPIRTPLLLSTPKLGLSPFDGSVRVAGTMELSGINLRLDQRRVDALERAVTPYLPDFFEGGVRKDWVGMRPLTPDGLPTIGALPTAPNVFVATGHAMLGITLAPSTGRYLTELIVDGKSSVDLSPFDPGRF